MIEIIILVIALGLFTLKSRQLGRNQLIWGVIATASFFGPLLFFGKLILPMVNQVDPYLGVQSATLDILGIGFGIAGCWLAFMRLVFIGPATTLSKDSWN